MCRKAPWRSKREGVLSYSKWCQQVSSLKSILAKRWACTHEISWDKPDSDLESNQQGHWSKETWKKCPQKWFKLPQGHDSLSESACVSFHMYHTLFFLLINTSLVSLLSVIVGILFLQSWRARASSLTTSLVARIWRFHRCDPAQPLAGNPSPTPNSCRPRLPEIRSRGVWWTSFWWGRLKERDGPEILSPYSLKGRKKGGGEES